MTAELHDTLLRVAGWAPDDHLADARTRLARGDESAAARILVFAGARTVLPLTEEDLDLLGRLLVADGDEPGMLKAVQLAAGEAPPWRFTAAPPADGGARDDGELLAAVAREPGARALWRSWRWPADGAPPRPVYVVETDPHGLAEDSGGLAGVTGRLQDLLAGTGEQAPRVEVVAARRELPPYQRSAKASGALLWTARPAEEPVVARVFDTMGAGQGFAPDHPRMTDESERQRTLGYLRAGTELLMTLGMLDDAVDSAKGAVVPMSFRTDGRWIWADAIVYYLEQYHLAPDPGLLRHIETMGGPPPRPDTDALHRAMAVLTRSPEDEDS